MLSQKNKLILVSCLGLFLELSLIRWLPAHAFSIAFFSNIVLIASFFGLGFGFLICEAKADLFKFFSVILTIYVIAVLLLQYVGVHLPASAQEWIWSSYYGNRLNNTFFLTVSLLELICIVFFLTTLVFIPIGQKIGRLMKGLKPLFAYSMNILGSLMGVIAFGLVSFFHSPAWVWFLIVGGLYTFVVLEDKGVRFNILLLVGIVLTVGVVEKNVIWSSYYAINVKQTDDKSKYVFVNQLFHQQAVNFTAQPLLFSKYLEPYRWTRPQKVLIIGSGTGNDVWAARQSGAGHIDAVEIDPVILKLGHPQNPYDSPNVRIFIDDARSFMHRTKGRYDMIVFGTLDSHASLSVASSIRLDNYVYTKQSLQEAKALLNPDGVIVLLFSIPTEWMAHRIFSLADAVFDFQDSRYMLTDNSLFNLVLVAGGGLQKRLAQNPRLAQILRILPKEDGVPVPSDDWPNLYLAKREIPQLYIKTLAVIIGISLAMVFILTPMKIGQWDPVFFFLGAGFLLLETKSVTTFSLLFGSTWIVNAITFSAILMIALLANWLVAVKHLAKPQWFLAGLMVSLIFLYLFPLSPLLNLNFSIKILVSASLIALPIFFSSFIFAILIKRTDNIGLALGSNLIGAVLGGFMEYSSMIWGFNVLYMVALCSYFLAILFMLSPKNSPAVG